MATQVHEPRRRNQPAPDEMKAHETKAIVRESAVCSTKETIRSTPQREIGEAMVKTN
jgi:hypothetical protein